MRPILVVLADFDTRLSLCQGLGAAGHYVIKMSSWDEIDALPRLLPMAAAVFDYCHLANAAAHSAGAFAILRQRWPEILKVALILGGPDVGGKSRWVDGVYIAPSGVGARLASAVLDALLGHKKALASKGVLDALHARVLNHDEVAREEFCALMLGELRRRFRTKLCGGDPDLADMAVDDALTKYALARHTFIKRTAWGVSVDGMVVSVVFAKRCRLSSRCPAVWRRGSVRYGVAL